MRPFWFLPTCIVVLTSVVCAEDAIREMQTSAIEANSSPVAHWGWDKDNYTLWGTHSNRLIPVYTFGTAQQAEGQRLTGFTGEKSAYRNEAKEEKIFGRLPTDSLNPHAAYMDQTNIYDLQAAALKAGRKHIILIVFDGMDWYTTRAASLYKTGRVAYNEGRGTGLHFQDYRAQGTSEFGFMVTSPYCDEAKVDINTQTVVPDKEALFGGYDVELAGPFPWSMPKDLRYIIGKAKDKSKSHAYTDSSSSATSMTTGIKTFNSAVNVDIEGRQYETIAQQAQKKGYKIGVVTSVPISHATPAAAYSHNVSRDDYQDLTRDLLGLPSISHQTPENPGVDVLIGGGFGQKRLKDNGQGENFVPGNAYVTEEDLLKIDQRAGGKYVVCQRTAGAEGGGLLMSAADDAIATNKRLFGFFGVDGGHLPFRTADGDFNPTVGRKKTAEAYTPEDLRENPNLSEFAQAALKVLSANDEPFWLMVEAGDVDWANHDNNIDNSIGAVISGDNAVKTVTDWVEKNSNWDETLVIVTADHGHYLVIDQPEAIAAGK